MLQKVNQSHTYIKISFGSVWYRITMFTHETNQHGLYRITFSCHLVRRNRVVPNCWSRAYRIHAELCKDQMLFTVKKNIRHPLILCFIVADFGSVLVTQKLSCLSFLIILFLSYLSAYQTIKRLR